MTSSSRQGGCSRSMKYHSLPHQQLLISSPSGVGGYPAGRRVHERSGQVLFLALTARLKMPGMVTWLFVGVTFLLAFGNVAAADPRTSTDGRRTYSVENFDAVVKEVLQAQRENRINHNRITQQINKSGGRQEANSSRTLRTKGLNSPDVLRQPRGPGDEKDASAIHLKQQDATLTGQVSGFESHKSSQNSAGQQIFSAETQRLRAESEELGRPKRGAAGNRGTSGVLSPEQEDLLGTLVGEVMACEHIPGLGFGIVRGDRRHSEGYGVADMETARPADRHTLFGIGSNTKVFAAATLSHVMQSMPPGKQFTWDTPLAEVLTDFQMPDKVRTAATTLTDILSHRTGLGSADIGFIAGFPPDMTTKDFVSRLRFLPEMYPFRDRWHYSNILYGVLTSLVCETMAGRPWSALVRDAICKPIGMNDTVMTSEVRQLDNVALPYILRMTDDDMFVQQDLNLFNIHPLEAAGAMMSSASDMTLWMEYLLQVLDNPSTSAQQSLKSIFVDRILLPSNYNPFRGGTTKMPVEFVGYALGLISANYRNTTIYQHTGDLHGYSSYVVLEPDDNTGVFLATNGPNSKSVFSALASLSFYVLDVVRGREPWVNVSVLCPAKKNDATSTSRLDDTADDDTVYEQEDYGDDEKTWDVNVKKLLRPVEDYEGIYGHGLLGNLHVIREEKRNGLRMELGRHLVADLVPTDQESVLSAVARGPLADTREWEKARPLLFRMTGEAPAARVNQSVSGDAQQTAAGLTDRQNQENQLSSGTLIAGSRWGPFSEVHFVWDLEAYVFRREVRFDTALNEQQPKLTMKKVGETEQQHPHARTETPTRAFTETSAQTPTERAKQTPTAMLTQRSTQRSAQTPTETSDQTPTERPTQTSTERPTQTSTERPTQTSAETPTQRSTERPKQTSTERPTQTSTERPTQTFTERPTQTFSAASAQTSTEESVFENTSLSAASIAKDSSSKSSSTSIGFLFVLALLCLATAS